MKKALVVLLALTCLGAAAFADGAVVKFTGTLNTGATIYVPSAGSTTIQVYDNNEPAITRSRFNVSAFVGDFGITYEFSGVALTPITNAVLADVPLLWGNSYWWVTANLFDKMIQLNVGSIDNAVTATVNKGWGGLSVEGFQLVVTPMSGLSVGLSIPVTANLASQAAFSNAGAGTIDTAMAGIIFGAFYTMPNMFSVAFTWMNHGGSNANNLAFGVNVLVIPNLTAQFEGQVKLLGDSNAQNVELFENAAYVMGPLTPALNLDEVLYAGSGMNVKFAINPSIDYVLMTGTAIGLSLTYTMNVAGGTSNALNVDPYVKFTFTPNAAVKIDANYTIPDLSATGTWNIPININFLYSF